MNTYSEERQQCADSDLCKGSPISRKPPFKPNVANGASEPRAEVTIFRCVRSQHGLCCNCQNPVVAKRRENQSFVQFAAKEPWPRIKSRGFAAVQAPELIWFVSELQRNEISLEPCGYGTHSMRRTKVAEIYRKTGNLRAVQLLLGHTKVR